MRLQRTFTIAPVIALVALATPAFGGPLSHSGFREVAAARQDIALTAVTANVPPLSDSLSPSLGPIPCPDGSTVDFGQFCPILTIQCADGTSVFVGQFCPVFKPAAPPPQQAPPPPQQAPPPDQQKCRELGTC